VRAANITVWLDFEATKSVFENDLPYMIRQLSPGDRFIFFYAGRGFFANGTNCLTTWDTHPGNLAGTTVSLEELLLKPLKDQQGFDSLVFIDSCAPVRNLAPYLYLGAAVGRRPAFAAGAVARFALKLRSRSCACRIRA
jgi:hypothetical protein